MRTTKQKNKKAKHAVAISYPVVHKKTHNELRDGTTPYILKTSRKQRNSTVAANRRYAVEFVSAAKSIASGWLKTFNLENAVGFGLPEVDDRYHIWRVPLVKSGTKERIGEVVIDAYTSLVTVNETTSPQILEARLLGRHEIENDVGNQDSNQKQMLASFVRNTVILFGIVNRQICLSY